MVMQVLYRSSHAPDYVYLKMEVSKILSAVGQFVTEVELELQGSMATTALCPVDTEKEASMVEVDHGVRRDLLSNFRQLNYASLKYLHSTAEQHSQASSALALSQSHIHDMSRARDGLELSRVVVRDEMRTVLFDLRERLGQAKQSQLRIKAELLLSLKNRVNDCGECQMMFLRGGAAQGVKGVLLSKSIHASGMLQPIDEAKCHLSSSGENSGACTVAPQMVVVTPPFCSPPVVSEHLSPCAQTNAVLQSCVRRWLSASSRDPLLIVASRR